ncbi:MAG: hypothetical protein WCG25_09730 [bacterium]
MSFKFNLDQAFNQPVFSIAWFITANQISQILLFHKCNIDHAFSQPVFARDSAIAIAHSSQI